MKEEHFRKACFRLGRLYPDLLEGAWKAITPGWKKMQAEEAGACAFIDSERYPNWMKSERMKKLRARLRKEYKK